MRCVSYPYVRALLALPCTVLQDTFSLWDLRAAMFLNNCLPATPRSPDDSQQQHFSDSSPSTDALKGATHPDTPGKRSTPADAHSSSRKQQQQQQQQQQSLSHGRGGVPILQLPHTAAGSPARGRAGSDADSSAGGDAATAEVVRLRRVIKVGKGGWGRVCQRNCA
jgi:hypothetical protein